MKRLTSLALAAAVVAGTLGASTAQAQDYHPWHPGDRYHGERHVEEHWRHDHLPRPPHGAEWVQDHGHFVLVRGDGVVLRVWGQ
jgi:Ni/Co efflux regulator RcnB